MPRFFVDSIIGDEIYIDGENGRHLVNSLRIKEGEDITICDGNGMEALCRVSSTDKLGAYCKVIHTKQSEAEADIKLRIFQGLPKSDKMELIIQKVTELGACEIIPTVTKNCVVKLDGKAKEEKKVARWQKIALEAAKQSGRGIIPQVRFPQSFRDSVIKTSGTKILFYEKGGISLEKALENHSEEISIFIGPEGGFEEAEIETAKENGVIIVGLGKRILRTETAPIAATAIIMTLTGNM